MAAQFLKDTLQDANLDISVPPIVVVGGPVAVPSTVRRIRTGIVTGIDTSTNPQIILETAFAAVIAEIPFLTAFNPANPTLVFNRLQVDPVNSIDCRVTLYYETNNNPSPSSSYILTDDTYMTSVQTDFLPGTRIPLRVNWQNPSNSADKVPADTVKFNFLLPVRAVTVNSLVYGRPADNAGYVGCVNSGTFMGLPKGYWLLSKYKTVVSRYANYFTVEAQVIAKSFEDWSYTGTLVNKLTGKRVAVSDADVAAMNALPYIQGIIYPTASPSTSNKGIIRVGPYPVADFGSITTVA